MTREERRKLAEAAVRAGALPSDPAVPFSATTDVIAETPCELCEQPLGDAPAFTLICADLAFLMHAECFSAWIDVVVDRKDTEE